MGIRSARASIPLVREVQNVPRIQRAALHCMVARKETCALVGATEPIEKSLL